MKQSALSRLIANYPRVYLQHRVTSGRWILFKDDFNAVIPCNASSVRNMQFSRKVLSSTTKARHFYAAQSITLFWNVCLLTCFKRKSGLFYNSISLPRLQLESAVIDVLTSVRSQYFLSSSDL